MKPPINLLTFLFFVFFPLFLFGQLRHEVKIALPGLFRVYTPSYELIINKKIGVEAELSFDLTKASILNGTVLNNNFNIEEFDRRRFSPSISGKYYFLFNEYGNGIYVGPYLKSIFNTYLEAAYIERYIQKNNRAAPYWTQNGLQRIFIGLNGGFKLLTKKRLILECSFLGTMLQEKQEDGKFEGKNFDLDLSLRIGYRF